MTAGAALPTILRWRWWSRACCPWPVRRGRPLRRGAPRCGPHQPLPGV